MITVENGTSRLGICQRTFNIQDTFRGFGNAMDDLRRVTRDSDASSKTSSRVKQQMKSSPLLTSSASDSTSIYSADSIDDEPRIRKPAIDNSTSETDTTSVVSYSSRSEKEPISTKGKLQSRIKTKRVFVHRKKPESKELTQNPVKTYYGMFDPLRKRNREPDPFWVTINDSAAELTVTDISPSPQSIVLSDPVSAALDAFLKRREIPPPEMIQPVLELMKSESVKAIIAEDYDYAEQLDKGAHELRRQRQWSSNVMKASETSKALDEKLAKARSELKAESDEWDRVLAEFKVVQQQQRNAMLEDHVREQREYEEKWNDPAMLIPFTKPSPQLLQLRKMQKKMALVKRFSEAKEIKRQAEQMQREEAKEAEKKAMATIKAGFDNVIERQRREIQCFDEHERRSITYIEQERKKATEPIEKQIRALEQAKQQEVEKQSVITRKTVVRKVEDSRRGVIPVGPPNPTSRQFMEYRKNEDPPRLNLNTMNLKRFVANRRVASSCRIVRVEK